MFPSEPPLPADMTHHFNPHQAYALGLHPTTAPNLCPATTSNPIEPCRINFTSLGSAGVSLLDYYKSPAMLDNGNQLVHELISKPVKPLDTLNIKFSVRWNSNMPDRPWLLTLVLQYGQHGFHRVAFVVGPHTTVSSLVEVIACNIHRLVRIVNDVRPQWVLYSTATNLNVIFRSAEVLIACLELKTRRRSQSMMLDWCMSTKIPITIMSSKFSGTLHKN